MVITLTNPVMETLSQAGGNLGSGLSDALGRYIENRRVQTALEGVTAETPINEILRKFSQSNVSPEYLNTFLSPTVQQRLGQERAANVYSQLAKMTPQDFNKLSYPQLVAQLAAASAQTPEGFRGIEPLLNAYSKFARGSGFMDMGNEAMNEPQATGQTNAPIDINVNQEPNIAPLPSPRTAPGAAAPTGFGQSPFSANIGAVPGLGQTHRGDAKQIWTQVNQMLANDPERDVSRALENVAKLNALSDAEVQRMYNTQEKLEQIRQTEIAEQNRITQAANTFLERDYGADATGRINLPPEIQNYVTELMKDDKKGTDEQRYTRAKLKAENLQDKIASLAEGEGRPLFGLARPKAVDDFIKRKAGQAASVLKDVPDHYKPFFREQMRTRLLQARRPGVEANMFGAIDPNEFNVFGPVEVERIVNPPSASLQRDISLLPEGVREIINPQRYAKVADKQHRNLVDFWFKAAGKENSPLYITQALIDKGYEQTDILRAYDEAAQSGADFSPYQDKQRSEWLNLKFVPDLSTIFGIDKATRTLRSVLSGAK